MTTSSFSPEISRKNREALAESIRFLQAPSEALLLGAVNDIAGQVAERQRRLLQERERLWQEINAVVSRILLKAEDFAGRDKADYFTLRADADQGETS